MAATEVEREEFGPTLPRLAAGRTSRKRDASTTTPPVAWQASNIPNATTTLGLLQVEEAEGLTTCLLVRGLAGRPEVAEGGKSRPPRPSAQRQFESPGERRAPEAVGAPLPAVASFTAPAETPASALDSPVAPMARMLPSAASATEDPNWSNAPVFERFYAGGFRSLRGFGFRGVGPETNGFRVGGDFMLLNSI